jgi:hypothetical protein
MACFTGALTMNISTQQSNIAFDVRPELLVTIHGALFSRLSQLPNHSNDNGGFWFLEAGFVQPGEGGVHLLQELQFLPDCIER